MDIRISQLNLYPAKSMAGVTVPGMDFDTSGPVGDRRIMVVDPSGKFMSQRDCPQLGLITATPNDANTWLEASGMTPHLVRRPAGTYVKEVQIHGQLCHGVELNPGTSDWVRAVIGRDCKVMALPPFNDRRVDPRFAPKGQLIAFTDGFQLMVMNQASVTDFNTRLATQGIDSVTMDHFRSNLVISGLGPYQEDGLLGRTFQVVSPRSRRRGVHVKFVKFNARCTTINNRFDASRTSVTPDPRILRSLGSYRTMNEPTTGKRGIMLGVNALVYLSDHRDPIEVGDYLVPLQASRA